MKVESLDHIAVTVSNTERSLEFYCDVLGLKQVEQHQLRAEDVKKADNLENARRTGTSSNSSTSRLRSPHSVKKNQRFS